MVAEGAGGLKDSRSWSEGRAGRFGVEVVGVAAFLAASSWRFRLPDRVLDPARGRDEEGAAVAPPTGW